eukprot:snap_masked-scaffold_6-processed-gene-3.25-mRNA-1 protein AED:1.00 eAED:1.00 QI:0/-1/0/0/-1/1/1/0/260
MLDVLMSYSFDRNIQQRKQNEKRRPTSEERSLPQRSVQQPLTLNTSFQEDLPSLKYEGYKPGGYKEFEVGGVQHEEDFFSNLFTANDLPNPVPTTSKREKEPDIEPPSLNGPIILGKRERRESSEPFSLGSMKRTSTHTSSQSLISNPAKTWTVWSQEEDVFLIGIIFDFLFERGSLSSNKGMDVWFDIKTRLDVAAEKYKKYLTRTNQIEKVPNFGDRAGKTLQRHFKTLKRKNLDVKDQVDFKKYYKRWEKLQEICEL